MADSWLRRYVASYVTHYQLENGYNIWSFQGKLLHTHRESKFYQFLWRPRPPSLLSKEKEKEIRKNLLEYEHRSNTRARAHLLSHCRPHSLVAPIANLR